MSTFMDCIEDFNSGKKLRRKNWEVSYYVSKDSYSAMRENYLHEIYKNDWEVKISNNEAMAIMQEGKKIKDHTGNICFIENETVKVLFTKDLSEEIDDEMNIPFEEFLSLKRIFEEA